MSFPRLLAGLVSLAIGLTVAGCAIYRSNEVVGGINEAPGIVYYLPKTLVTITITPFGTLGDTPEKHVVRYLELTPADTAKQTLLVEHVPDQSQPYVLNYNANPLTTDHVCAGTSNGLLMGVQASSADETGNIIVSIAKLAGRLAAPSPFSLPPPGEEYDGVEIPGRKFSLTIDPLDPDDLAAVSATIRRRFPGLANDNYQLAVEDAHYLSGDGLAAAPCPENSVCYRTAVTTRIKLASARRGRASIAYANVINRAVTGHIDVSRAFMVDKITLLAFDKGVLKDVKIKKPSEALAVAKLPLTVLDAITTSLLAAPGNFLANASGFSNEQRQTLVKQAATNAANVAKLQAELAKIRDGDVLAGDRFEPTGKDDVFQVTCKTN